MPIVYKYFSDIKDISEIDDSTYIRMKVFHEEQNIDKDIIMDKDDYISTHLIMYLDEQPIASCRILESDNKLRIGRVALLKELRGKGYAEMLMKEAFVFCKSLSDKVYVSAQLYIKKFYEKIGFVQISDVYMNDGIEHVFMVRDLE